MRVCSAAVSVRPAATVVSAIALIGEIDFRRMDFPVVSARSLHSDRFFSSIGEIDFRRIDFPVLSVRLAASTTRVPPAPLPLPVIRSVDHGAISGEIVVQVEAIPKAVHYEIRYGAQVNGAAPGSWTSKVVTKVRPPVRFQGLAPGSVYAFQVRALGKVGSRDWTDSATCMCT